MKAYSIDLRQKIIEVYETTPISQRQLAQRFSVALSFIQKLLKQYRATGKIAPKPHGGGRKPKLTPAQMQILAELNQQKNDSTLEELQFQLYEKTGVRVSQATVFRTIKRLELTLKKNSLSDG